MGRWADRESDEERLPEGFQRIGYDADTQTYTFRDTTSGALYESEPGNQFGTLHPTGERSSTPDVEMHNARLKKSSRESVKMMLPFALLAIVFLLLVFRFLSGASGAGEGGGVQARCGEGTHAVQVRKGDTCYEMAKAHGLDVDALLGLEGNEGVDCEALGIGEGMCVPE